MVPDHGAELVAEWTRSSDRNVRELCSNGARMVPEWCESECRIAVPRHHGPAET